MRLLNFCVMVVLALATAYVYEIKFEATVRLTRVAEMRSEVRREHDAIATLRAEWARLENPGRLEGLSKRHLKLQPPEIWQFDHLEQLPARAHEVLAPLTGDTTIADEGRDPDFATGSIQSKPRAR
jgi:hypothetical protein